jgi:hypothetical protein
MDYAHFIGSTEAIGGHFQQRLIWLRSKRKVLFPVVRRFWVVQKTRYEKFYPSPSAAPADPADTLERHYLVIPPLGLTSTEPPALISPRPEALSVQDVRHDSTATPFRMVLSASSRRADAIPQEDDGGTPIYLPVKLNENTETSSGGSALPDIDHNRQEAAAGGLSLNTLSTDTDFVKLQVVAERFPYDDFTVDLVVNPGGAQKIFLYDENGIPVPEAELHSTPTNPIAPAFEKLKSGLIAEIGRLSTSTMATGTLPAPVTGSITIQVNRNPNRCNFIFFVNLIFFVFVKNIFHYN